MYNNALVPQQPMAPQSLNMFRQALRQRKEQMQRDIRAIDQLLEMLPKELPAEVDEFLERMYFVAQNARSGF